MKFTFQQIRPLDQVWWVTVSHLLMEMRHCYVVVIYSSSLVTWIYSLTLI